MTRRGSGEADDLVGFGDQMKARSRDKIWQPSVKECVQPWVPDNMMQNVVYDWVKFGGAGGNGDKNWRELSKKGVARWCV